MPTVQEVAAQVKWLLEHHRGHEKAVLVLPRVNARRKQKNPQRRFAKEMDDTFAARFYKQWDRWMEASPNKTVMIEIMLTMLEGVPDETIRDAANEQATVNFNLGRDEHVGE